MQVSFRNLLATGLVALVVSCTLNHNGLGTGGGSGAGAQGTGGTAGAATSGEGAAGMTATPSGTAGVPVPTTGIGGADASGTAGADAAAGAGGDGGTAGANPSGAAGVGGTAGVDPSGAAGAGGDTTGAGGGVDGQAGNGGAGGSMVTPVDPVGCSDGTREGFVTIAVYPNIAACAGGWDEPGLLSMASRTPECERHAGNESNNPDGTGCSVADLCSAGWHVCETAQAVAAATTSTGCAPAFELYLAKPAFFVTRERAEGLVCDATNQTGTNNVYGCGNIGSAADRSCAPFTHMLRDSDCANHAPWNCAGNSQDEYAVVRKASSAAGGALCCAD